MPKLRTSLERQARRDKCIENYATKSKYRAVKRWPARIAMNRDLTVKHIAKILGKSPPRISEYITFLIEPPEETFIAIEKILYEFGV